MAECSWMPSLTYSLFAVSLEHPLALSGKAFSNSCLLLSEKSSENLIYRFSTFQLAAKNMGLINVHRFPGSVRASMGKILRWCCKPSCAVRKEENALGFPRLFQDPHVLLSCLAQCRWLHFSTRLRTHVTEKNVSMLCKSCFTC